MTSLIYFIFFVIFIVLAYFLSYYPTNKLQLSIVELERENKQFKEIDNTFPASFNTILFSKGNEYTNSNINTYYNSQLKTITVNVNSKKQIFYLDNEDDVHTLLPILLLSK
ncbi:entry-fusion complex component [Hypsugopox virus]|nr:entry-fusion complex component [Hypsugopox virus]